LKPRLTVAGPYVKWVMNELRYMHKSIYLVNISQCTHRSRKGIGKSGMIFGEQPTRVDATLVSDNRERVEENLSNSINGFSLMRECWRCGFLYRSEI